MANKLYDESAVSAIAAAIRGKNGLTTQYKISDMAAAINAISSGLTIPSVETYHTTFTGTGASGSMSFSYTLSSSTFTDGVILFTADNISQVKGNGIIYMCIDLGQSSPNPIKATIVNYASSANRCYNNRQATNITVTSSQVTFTLPSNAVFTNGCTYNLSVCRFY